jgi:murein DD-endopeptidase MepM/ murein hydrolase activator NlpD
MKWKRRIIWIISIFLLVVVLVMVLVPGFFFAPEKQPPVIPVEIREPKLIYGIDIDSCQVFKSRVKQNQSLSDLLSVYGVSFASIHELAQLSRLTFDVRKIRTGNDFTVIVTNKYPQEALYFIYEETPADYIVFRLKDTLSVTRGAKPIDKQIRSTGGVITSSLWNSMEDNGTDPELANVLSDVYAWTIDFFGIQKGDYYQVIYEESFVEGISIGIGRVLASNFHNLDRDNYAVWFIQNNEGDYFDEQAQSLRRAFLKAPLTFKRISSKFSYSRYHPVLKIRRPHLGVDYAADAGTPVHTIGDGVVIEKAYDKKGGGNYLKIKHNSTYTTVYMHLQGFAKGIKSGSRVRQGDLIGYVGSTGLATGPHLDFRVFRNGQAIDPLKMESPPAKPVDAANLVEFNTLKDSLVLQVKQVPILGFSDPIQ